jgi:hypothetical protein
MLRLGKFRSKSYGKEGFFYDVRSSSQLGFSGVERTSSVINSCNCLYTLEISGTVSDPYD